jgi:hypothetical protein
MPDRPKARDVDVTVTIDGERLEGEVTLLPAQHDGSYGSWGDADNWVSGKLLQRLLRLDEAGKIEVERVLGELDAVAGNAADESE